MSQTDAHRSDQKTTQKDAHARHDENNCSLAHNISSFVHFMILTLFRFPTILPQYRVMGMQAER